MNRRGLLKIAGSSAVMGIGGVSLMQALQNSDLEASHVLQDEKALKAKRWAMVVDMDKFRTEEDYQRIITACHGIHNVPDLGKSHQEIKWIWTDTYEHTFPGQENRFMEEKIRKMPFVLLCNHCDNPPCVRVCPTKATIKRQDGIVMMDQHRCIGCRFCMAACPFGARMLKRNLRNCHWVWFFPAETDKKNKRVREEKCAVMMEIISHKPVGNGRLRRNSL